MVITCTRCQETLLATGAVLYSPPQQWMAASQVTGVQKIDLCRKCYDDIAKCIWEDGIIVTGETARSLIEQALRKMERKGQDATSKK
jgi:hypothetical protein